MGQLFYSFINWYSTRFSFPKPGLKYFMRLLKMTGNQSKAFIKTLHNGLKMKLHPQEHIQRQIFWYGYYEKDQVLCFESFLKPGMTVADIGANAGYYSLIASPKILSGRVYSFEPSPLSYKELKENITLNKISNIIPINMGISSLTTESSFYISNADNTGMSGLTRAGNFSGSVETIQLTTLDEFVRKEEIDKIDIIKMDIEGAEVQALMGMQNTIAMHRPIIFAEVCQELLTRFNNTVNEIYVLMKAKDYKAYQLMPENGIMEVDKSIEDELVLFLPVEYILPEKIRLIKA